MEGTDVKGFVTMCDYQCGVEGSAAEMPKASREIESVCGNASASVRPFLSYFGFEGVLDVLIRERLKRNDVKGKLPPRKFWSRGGVRERTRIDHDGRKVRRYDGETRIRKESVEKHIRSLGRETAKAVRELEKGELNADGFAWFSRFRNRLIRKGVGYVTAKLKDCDCCWAAAFGKVTLCGETRQEMRRLDRVRENMLTKVATLLRERGAEVKKGHRYKGNPFSYHAFLMKTANRPTNLRGFDVFCDHGEKCMISQIWYNFHLS